MLRSDQPKREVKLYQDQLYGAKALSPLAIAVIDSPEFQRLSGLRQLGFADVAYRGAHHTRFEHSIGTYFMARTMLRRIAQNHERLELDHPGSLLSNLLVLNPANSNYPQDNASYQAVWRGVIEIVSVAALIHDLGHVPYGHTLEDEFAGLYERHDDLAGPRLNRLLFDERSDLAKVFSNDASAAWLPKLKNSDIAKLIYVILNWKENIDNRQDFLGVITSAREYAASATNRILDDLEQWYTTFSDPDARLFSPFMSDVVGNTICADLLDYLQRDRLNLGMGSQRHDRLQRYFTLKEGKLRSDEGVRMSIMVTRKGRGGQKRDVATSILDIMRERYEMAERVFYNHKKAAASAMLVKLLELTPRALRPRDDDAVYPAPWTKGEDAPLGAPHLTHMSDTGLLEYLGCVNMPDASSRNLQKRLYKALKYRRNDYYKTLLVFDQDLLATSDRDLEFFSREIRGSTPNGEGGRISLERELADAATISYGEVIVYWPGRVQSKEVDVRTEIQEGRILPLRIQRELFAYSADLNVLSQYYAELWRAYVFVSREVFSDARKCQLIVDAFCEHFQVDRMQAYRKVRTYDFVLSEGVTFQSAFSAVGDFLRETSIADLPQTVTAGLLNEAAADGAFLKILKTNEKSEERDRRLTTLLEITTVKKLSLENETSAKVKKQLARYETHLRQIGTSLRPAARESIASYEAYCKDILTAAVSLGAPGGT